MIVTSVYKNDDNELLKMVQHDDYMRSVGSIFRAATSALVRADALLGTELLIVEKARAVTTFDHRALQGAHDILAATYRYRHDDGGQMRLFEEASAQATRYCAHWRMWLGEQLQELVEYPQFVRSVVESVIFANSVMGTLAERRACGVLHSHYSTGDWELLSGG